MGFRRTKRIKKEEFSKSRAAIRNKSAFDNKIEVIQSFPKDTVIASLDNDFFASLEDSNGNKMNQSGLIALGKESDHSLNNTSAYIKGVKEFHLEPSRLINLFKEKPNLKANTIVAVSNSNHDGASSLQEHYKLFENEHGSLDGVRRSIYRLSDAIFSGNPADREFFLGKNLGAMK